MATTFESLYPFIRALVGDSDVDCQLYSDDVLCSQIRLAILLECNDNIAEQGSSKMFDDTLTQKEKAIVVLRSAIQIFCPQPERFSHAGPVLRVARAGGIKEAIAKFEKSLSDIRGGKFACSTDTEFQALCDGLNRWICDLNHAWATSGSCC